MSFCLTVDLHIIYPSVVGVATNLARPADVIIVVKSKFTYALHVPVGPSTGSLKPSHGTVKGRYSVRPTAEQTCWAVRPLTTYRIVSYPISRPTIPRPQQSNGALPLLTFNMYLSQLLLSQVKQRMDSPQPVIGHCIMHSILSLSNQSLNQHHRL